MLAVTSFVILKKHGMIENKRFARSFSLNALWEMMLQCANVFISTLSVNI